MTRRSHAPKVWRAPIAVALLSLVGLLSALFADGVGDVISWGALAVPVALCLWYPARSR